MIIFSQLPVITVIATILANQSIDLFKKFIREWIYLFKFTSTSEIL